MESVTPYNTNLSPKGSICYHSLPQGGEISAFDLLLQASFSAHDMLPTLFKSSEK